MAPAPRRSSTAPPAAQSLAAVALAVALLLAGCAGWPAGGDRADDGPGGTGPSLTVDWVSDTAVDIRGNHHEVAVGTADGTAVVYAPISAAGGTDGCRLVALAAANGTELWDRGVPPANCTLHSVADPSVGDFDGDGTAEVLAATTEKAVVALHPRTGETELRHDLTAYGYTRPIVADVAPRPGVEVVVADVTGRLYVVAADGSTVWNRSLSGYTWATPTAADLDDDGDVEVAMAVADGTVAAFDGRGRREWTVRAVGTVTWQTAVQADADPAVEVVVATEGGVVAALDGRNGSREWTHTAGAFAAVHAAGDGDRDGDPEVYVTSASGRVQALDAATGDVEWGRQLTEGREQMMPPATMGDVDGDGDPELVAVTNSGNVSVLDPVDGQVLATHEREGTVYAHARLADVDDDGAEEAFVVYGDGTVVALSFEQ